MALRGSRLGEATPLRKPRVSVRRQDPWMIPAMAALLIALSFGFYVQRHYPIRKPDHPAVTVVTTGPAAPAFSVTRTTTKPTGSSTQKGNSVPAATATSSNAGTQNAPSTISCGVLDPKYCDTGKVVQYNGQTYIALTLPVGTEISAPFDNTLTFTGFLGSNPAHPVAKDVEIASFASMVGANLMTSKTAAVIVAGDGLLPGLTSGWDKSGNITNTHPYAKGDVVATLKSDDKISGLGDVNVLLAFGGSGGTINALFASEAKKVQSGNETVEQLLQNMVEAVQGFTTK